MKFRTDVKIPKTKTNIHHQTKTTCLGSCFAENIGSKLSQSKMDIIINPTGIMYNPFSLYQTISRGIENIQIDKKELFEQQGRWVHYDFHSEMSSTESNLTCKNINSQIGILHDQIINSDVLILSLGTAFVFRLKSDNTIVNNCHKMPSNLFSREVLSYQEVKDILDSTFLTLWEKNPKLKIILTVSPVRHVRDGLIENQRSKSTLHLAIQELKDQYDSIDYFPSYEIVLDDLRDYRFYKKDMIHPSDEAVDYIWDLFSNHFFDQKTKDLNRRISSVLTAISHRPFNPESKEHQLFKSKYFNKIKQLKELFPFLALESELNYFR